MESLHQQLIDAIKKEQTNLVRQLLEQGADVHAKNDEPLFAALLQHNSEMLEIILDAGANVHVGDDMALRYAAQFGFTKMVSLLLDADANIHANNDIALRETTAAVNEHKDTVIMLLDKGANVHADNDISLQNAAYRGYIEIVRILLDAGAKPTAFNGEFHPYMNMSDETKNTILTILKNYRPNNPDEIIDDAGTTRLMSVAQHGPTYKLREYLTRTQSVNQQDKLGNTALMYAVNSNDYARIKLLFENDANPLSRNKAGHTPWDYAESINNTKILALLLPTVRMMQRGVPLDIRQMVDQYM